MDELGPIDIEILLNNPQLLANLKRAESDFQNTNRNITNTVRQSSNELDGWAKKAAIAATSYFSVTAAVNFVKELVNVRGEFEQLTVAYETILKSKTKGDALFAETVKFAATTPFNLTEVAASTKQLLAYGFGAKDITATLTTLGDIASGVSIPLSQIVYLYGTLRTQGRAYQKDIQQFTGAGIPLIAELAKQFGVTDDQVNKLVESGKVGFPEVEKAFKSLSGSGGIFFNLMEKQSLTLTGQLSNLEDAFAQMINKLGASQEGILNGGISAAADLINNYQSVLDIIEVLIVVYGSYRAALLAEVAISKIVAISNSAQSVSHLLLQGAIEAQTAATAILNSEMLASAISTAAFTAGIAGLALITYSLVTATTAAQASANALKEINVDAEKSTLSLRDKTESLANTVTDLNKLETTRIDALHKLRDITGDRLKQYSDEEIKAGKAKAAIEAYTNSLIENAKTAAAANKIQELEGKLIDVDNNNLSVKDRILEGLGDVLHGNFYIDQKTGDQLFKDKIQTQINSIKDKYQKEIDKANVEEKTKSNTSSKFTLDLNLAVSAKGNGKLLADYNKLVAEASGKTDLESLQKALEDKLALLAPNDKQQAALKIKLIALKKLLDTYSIKADASGLADLQSEAQRRADIIQKIYQLNEKYKTNSLSDDNQKLQSIRDEYDKLRADIDKYNANPKNKQKISKAGFQNNEFAATSNQADLNENDYIKADIEKKKALYSEYQDYRDKVGKDAADKEYQYLLLSGSSYKAYLQTLDSSVPAGPLSGALTARKELVAKASLDEKKEQASKNVDLLADTLSYEQQTNLIIEKYLQRAADLRKQGKDKEAEQALKQGEAVLDQRKLDAEQQLETYRNLSDSIIGLTVKEATERLKQAEITAKSDVANGKISEEQYEKIIQIIQKLKQAVKDNIVDQALGEIAAGFDKIAQSLSGVDSELAGTFNSLAKAFALAKQLSDDIKNLKKGLDDYGKNKEKASGGFLGSVSAITNLIPIVGSVISGVISAVGSVVKFFKASKESAIASAKELQRYQDSLISGQVTYNELIRDRERTQANITSLTIQELDARQKLLGTQTSQAQADYNKLLAQIQGSGQQITGEHTEKYGGFLGIGKKTRVVQDLAGLGGADYDKLEKLSTEGKLTDATKAWFEQLQKVHDEMGSISDATDEVNDQLKQIFTGTTADELGKSILDGLKAGKRGFKDFSDDFGTSIQSALDSVFEESYLKDKVAAFYETFAKLSKSGGGLNAAEIEDLKNQYMTLVNGASDAYADIQKITGSTTAASTKTSTLSNAVSGISADQADLLAGQLGGLRLAQLEQVGLVKISNVTMVDTLSEIRSQTLLQKAIEANTRRTADNTDVLPAMSDTLKSIDKKTGSGTASLLANGKI